MEGTLCGFRGKHVPERRAYTTTVKFTVWLCGDHRLPPWRRADASSQVSKGEALSWL